MANTYGTYPELQCWSGGKDWLDDARCARQDADRALFFVKDRLLAERALWFCRRCSVRQQCLEFALVNDHRYGIWGGISEGKRRRLHEERETASQATLGEERQR